MGRAIHIHHYSSSAWNLAPIFSFLMINIRKNYAARLAFTRLCIVFFYYLIGMRQLQLAA